jgi:hypothetical protein
LNIKNLDTGFKWYRQLLVGRAVEKWWLVVAMMPATLLMNETSSPQREQHILAEVRHQFDEQFELFLKFSFKV